jgi:hypothetical protein
MARLIFPITPDGLCVDVVVGLDGKTTVALHVAGRPIPKPSRGRGVIDTGSNVTCVNLPILQGLGIPVKHRSTTQGIAGPVAVNLYEVSLSLTDFGIPGAPLLVEPTLLVMELPAALPNVDVLIGLDVLLGCRMTLDGPARQFTLDF